MTWPNIQVHFVLTIKLNCYDRADKVYSMEKTRQENDMTNRIGAVYIKIEIEMSLSIRQDVVNHENQKE